MKLFDLSKHLEKYPVSASAPVRVDCGGSLDQRLVSLLLANDKPCTANLALDLRTRVSLYPYEKSRVRIKSGGFGDYETSWPNFDFNSKFGLVLAVVSHFQVTGIEIRIHSASPPLSGLGGSGSLCVSLIAAISKAIQSLDQSRMSKTQIVWLAHHIEDSLYQNTGLQDQMVAMYGGVNLWCWDYTRTQKLPERQVLNRDSQVLTENILVAYTGQPHPISHGGSRIVKALKENHRRDLFSQLIKNTQTFAFALKNRNYQTAGNCLSKEGRLRELLVAGTYTPLASKLIGQAKKLHCGAKIPGFGSGGCAWAIGNKKNINKLRVEWSKSLETIPKAKLLSTKITRKGLTVELLEK